MGVLCIAPNFTFHFYTMVGKAEGSWIFSRFLPPVIHNFRA